MTDVSNCVLTLREQLDTVHFGHVYVRYDHVNVMLGQDFKGAFAVLGGYTVISQREECPGKAFP